ncbi:MAG: cytochrome b5 domain-containing protein [Myxococcota bacterium]
MRPLKKLLSHQLALYNGQDKKQIYVAYEGKIYDVSESRLWKKGQHYEHWAGQDLTEELKDAPHAEEVFLRFKQVGELIVHQ